MRAPLSLITLLAAALPAGAVAQVVSEKPDRVAVVLYQDHAPRFRPFGEDGEAVGDVFGDDPGLAVVSEVRTVDLPAGRTRIRFRGVADGMVAQTAAIEGLDGRLIERNYDFDLLSPGTLIEKGIGAPARLVRTNPKTGQVFEAPVTVRSGPDGIVLQHADGSAEALGCSDLPEKLVFDQAPPGLTATPTLSAEVETATAGRHVIRLSYLATGLRWKADYVARLNPDGRTLDLHGWLTLSNLSGTTFGDAPTQVVAGRLARAGEDEPVAAQAVDAVRSCWPTPFARRYYSDTAAAPPPAAAMMARMSGAEIQEVVVTASRIAEVSNLGDYKLYTLPEPTTVAANQTKQVAFLEQAAVPFRRVYSYRAEFSYDGALEEPIQVPIVLRLQNKAAEGLGKPLPGGTVLLFEPKPGGELAHGEVSLGGQAQMKDTPTGLPVEWRLPPSALVTVEAEQGNETPRRSGGSEFRRSEVTLTFRNASGRPAPVEVRLDQSSVKVLGESRPHTRDGAAALWTVQVPAEGAATLRYRVEHQPDF